MQQSKTCPSCNQLKTLDLFPQKTRESIKLSKPTSGGYCKECNAKRAREWRKANPGYRTTGKVKSLPIEERPWMSAVRSRLTDAKSRSKKHNLVAPDITDQYLYNLLLAQNKKCALTGADLLIQVNHPLCLSLDQINPAMGYVEGNVQWLAWCVNRAKGDLSNDDFFDMCSVIVDKQKVQRLS